MKHPDLEGTILAQLKGHEQVHDEKIVACADLVTTIAKAIEGIVDASDSSGVKVEYQQRFRGFVSLRLLAPSVGVIFSVGIVLPGEYDFGVHKNPETIRVLMGALKIKDETFVPGGQACFIGAGERAVIKTEVPSAYLRT